MNDDGTMARLPDLIKMAEQHDLKICTIKDMIKYRMRNERLVRRGAETTLPTDFGGDFRLIVYENDVDELTMSPWSKEKSIPMNQSLCGSIRNA